MDKLLAQCIVFLCVCLANINVVFAENADQKNSTSLTGDDVMAASLLGDDLFVSIATGTIQPIRTAPQVVTLITSDKIDKMGATSLEEVLESVPGFHVSTTTRYQPIFSIRGLRKDFNSTVVFLRNDIPMPPTIFGGRDLYLLHSMVVEDISRVEVARGPGSALYGADAFSGAVNVTTKNIKEKEGSYVGGTYFSDESWRAWFRNGSKIGSAQLLTTLYRSSIQGAQPYIEEDAQTRLDELAGTNASLAPTTVDTIEERAILNMELHYGGFDGEIRVNKLWDKKHGVGFVEAIPPDDETVTVDSASLDLKYNKKTSKNWAFSSFLSYNWGEASSNNLHLLPPGSFGVPDGFIDNLEHTESYFQIEGSANYKGDRHNATIGLGYNIQEVLDVTRTFNYVFVNGRLVPTSLQVESGEEVFDVMDRQVAYMFLQDEWTFHKDFEATLGIRLDEYSDFGLATSPRAALVWLASYDTTVKALYGRAFRSPTFFEMNAREDHVANIKGNPDLKPETIDTLELVLDKQGKNYRNQLNIYHYWIENFIREEVDEETSRVGNVNSGSATGYGVEFETFWNIVKNLALTFNASINRSNDKETDAPLPYSERYKVYTNLNYLFYKDWSITGEVIAVGDRNRPADDVRERMDGYQIFNLAFQNKPTKSDWKFSAGVKNMFDKDTREPSSNPGTNIPDDLPNRGRTYFAGLEFHF